jgi:hypothetical protein
MEVLSDGAILYTSFNRGFNGNARTNSHYWSKAESFDPCCGSGRMLIASHAKAPGNFQFGADIDPICAKMSAINMLVHGCVGEISCMDSIAYEWRFGYKINTYLNSIGHPTLIKIEKFEDSYFYAKPNKPQTKVIPRGEFVPAKHEPKVLNNGQMSLSNLLKISILF